MTKQTFDHHQKVKNFKMDLSHSIFPVHSDFGTRSFIRDSKIVQTSNFQKVDFCANVDQTSNFLRWTYLAQFFVYIPNLGSISSFENPKLLKWCDSTTVGFEVNFDQESRHSSKVCPICTFTKILILKSTYLFWTW